MSKSLLDKWTFVNRVNADPELPPGAAKVMMTLVWYMNCKYQECFPKQSSICKAAALSERAVRDACVALRQEGWLTWEPRMVDGRKVGHEYRVNWDNKPEVTAPDQTRQEPEQPAQSAGPVESNRQDLPVAPAQSAGPYEHGKRTREPIPSSTKTASEPEKKPRSSSAETRLKATAQHGSPEWYRDQIWKEQYPLIRERYCPGMSDSACRKRLGEIIRRQGNDWRAVQLALSQLLTADPGGDVWEYLSGILRKPPGDRPRGAPNVRGLM